MSDFDETLSTDFREIIKFQILWKFDLRESVRRDITMKVTNKMQLCMLIYYS